MNIDNLLQKLKRPLCGFDIEGTGVDTVNDRIITLCVTKLIPPGEIDPFGETVTRNWKFHPGFPIPEQSTKIHGIKDADVKDCPEFRERAGEVFDFIADCDLAGYNIVGYDIPMLWEHFDRAGIDWDLSGVLLLDSSEVFRKKERRDLTSAVKKYLARDHDGAHEAEADVTAALEVLDAQLAVYSDLGAMSVDQLSEFCQQTEFEGQPARKLDLAGHIIVCAKGVPRFTAKKVRGVPVVNDKGFARWMLSKDFPTHTKRIIEKILHDDATKCKTPTHDEIPF